jgi:NAD-dependent SIR2 family protein deacetylase
MGRSDADLTFGNADAANCKCSMCSRERAFTVPKQLFSDFLNGSAIIFAGAGISTENRNVHPDTFYDEVLHALGAKQSTDLNFPDLMQQFVDWCGDRHRLMEILEKRLKNIHAFRDMHSEATAFHRELSSLFFLKTVITTNWDRSFEDECGFTPFVHDTDIPFWDSADRQLLKLHGSIDNRGSIVATRKDYDRLREKIDQSLVFKHLASLIARKTIVFIGYSVRDETFLSVFNEVRRILGDFQRTPYLVSPLITATDKTRIGELGIRHIDADGTFFIKSLKHYAYQEICIIEDIKFDEIASILDQTRSIHLKTSSLSILKNPNIIFTLSYQDGILHACERILKLYKIGEYSNRHRVQRMCRNYEGLFKKYIKRKDYWNASYVRGYQNVLIVLLSDERSDDVFPYFFDFAHKEIEEISSYKEMLRNKHDHPDSRRVATRIITEKKIEKGMVVEHRAWL